MSPKEDQPNRNIRERDQQGQEVESESPAANLAANDAASEEAAAEEPPITVKGG